MTTQIQEDLKIYVLQDGADFECYKEPPVNEDIECEYVHTPFKVPDMDAEKAQEAREWFINRCKEKNVEIIWA